MDAAPRRPRYASLDQWRGLACLLVVVYHSTMLVRAQPSVESDSHGMAERILFLTRHFNVGVPLFFVISGYCIATAVDRLRCKPAPVWSYFYRRFRRIYPPLWAAILLLGPIVFLVDSYLAPNLLGSAPWPQHHPWELSPGQWFGNLTLTETWRYHFAGARRASFPGQAWTLCYEEQFYLVTGLLLLACPRYFFRAVAGLSAVVFSLSLVRVWTPLPVEGFFFDGLWLMFAAGVLVYYHLNYATPGQARLLTGVLIVGIVASPWLFDRADAIHHAAAGLFALLLIALRRWDAEVSQARLLRPLGWCGTMCYSLYLVHQIPVKILSAVLLQAGVDGPIPTGLITVPCCLAVSILLGWGFHVWVERRFLNPAQTTAAVPQEAIRVGAKMPSLAPGL